MFKKISYSSAIAFALLVAPTTKMFAGSTPTLSIVTGGDPQPSAMSPILLLSTIPSLAVL